MAKICLVEDDPAVRAQLALLLEHAGHEVTALERFDHLPEDILAAEPDAVVLDLGLPGTDGQYVARALRQRSDVPHHGAHQPHLRARRAHEPLDGRRRLCGQVRKPAAHPCAP
ncbi:MAG: response regulator [Atopobiaceae bacterium]|nr:response regulator [Atopobiaceae bacterium]